MKENNWERSRKPEKNLLKNYLDEFKKNLIIDAVNEDENFNNILKEGDIKLSEKNKYQIATQKLFKRVPSDIKIFFKQIAKGIFQANKKNVDEVAFKIYRTISTNIRDFLLVKPEYLTDADDEAYRRYEEIKTLKKELENIKNNNVDSGNNFNIEIYQNKYNEHLDFFDNYGKQNGAENNPFEELRKKVDVAQMNGQMTQTHELLQKFANQRQNAIQDYGTVDKNTTDPNKAIKNLFKNLVNGHLSNIALALEDIQERLSSPKK